MQELSRKMQNFRWKDFFMDVVEENARLSPNEHCSRRCRISIMFTVSVYDSSSCYDDCR